MFLNMKGVLVGGKKDELFSLAPAQEISSGAQTGDIMPAQICTRPFEWFEVHADGNVFCCCPAWVKKPLGNLLQDDLQSIWNGDRARLLRRTPLHGCSRSRCPHLLDGSKPVQEFSVLDPELRRHYGDNSGLLPWGPKTLNLCYDPRCNLACPSCRKSAPDVDADLLARLTERVLSQVAPTVENLRLSGHGDPFAAPSYRFLLKNFCRDDWPQLQQIHLHSNGLLWDAATWAEFPTIQPFVTSAEISVDAASAATYSLNRPGGDFFRLLDNLDFISRLPLRLKLSCVVQANNFREMPAFVQLAKRLGASVYFSQLVNWGTFSRDEFSRRAVHRPEHPLHQDFLSILQTISLLPPVDFGNLLPFLSSFPCKNETAG